MLYFHYHTDGAELLSLVQKHDEIGKLNIVIKANSLKKKNSKFKIERVKILQIAIFCNYFGNQLQKSTFQTLLAQQKEISIVESHIKMFLLILFFCNKFISELYFLYFIHYVVQK